MYIIDGKKVTTEDANKINPNDIANINVLKGEAAIALYGEEGKNGLIIITTKKKLETPENLVPVHTNNYN